MSTGKRLAKRSIIGTRICAPGEDGLFYSGVIQSVKTPTDHGDFETNMDTLYSVRFDYSAKKCPSLKREFYGSDIIGPGFQTLTNIRLNAGQKVYLTYNGREISGHIVHHNCLVDEVSVSINPPGFEGVMEIKKRLEEIRLLESRKSARLMDQDTDFARLADMAADRKRASSNSIEVPMNGSRKRRTSSSNDDFNKDEMNECTAALVLMSLSCSPNSSLNGNHWIDQPLSPSASFSDCASWRSGTPSPPLSESGGSGIWGSITDEGIVLDEEYDEYPRKRKMNRTLFQCTWPGCMVITTTCESIEAHVRVAHLGPRREKSASDNGYDEDIDFDDHEEEFYYTEVETEEAFYSPPTLSHRDMARPPHEDPEYQKSLLNPSLPSNRRFSPAGPINIPKNTNTNVPWSFSATNMPANSSSPVKHLKLSFSAPASKLPSSPTRRVRGETKKCRKVYGMEHRELWCTQCKWKKACSRFGD
ncbi:zinc finger protein 395-like isoform X2 [Planococcus citri]|uniref:zinc finger protein 395-like isoform X2 n=1 Tax=Planococcus citri TaxID=170843 RepID=UPI0031F9A155